MLASASTVVIMGTVIKQSGKPDHSPKMRKAITVFRYMTPCGLVVLVFCRNVLSFSCYTFSTFTMQEEGSSKALISL